MNSNDRVIILGATGMLGSTIFNYFSLKSNFEVWGTYRSERPTTGLITHERSKLISFDFDNYDCDIHSFIKQLNPIAIINCIGVIKQRAEAKDVLSVVPINTLLPHQLQISATNIGAKLIHISTDCVFCGSRGNYFEHDNADASDVYGLSKYLGEVTSKNSLTLRTSIIGHEIYSKISLLEWFLSQDKQIDGYTNAYFSGLPTNEVARVILNILEEHTSLSGLYHLSAGKISKYDLLSIINKIYNKNLQIVPSNGLKIDRSLRSDKLAKNIGYKAKSWDRLIVEMKAFKDEIDRYLQ